MFRTFDALRMIRFAAAIGAALTLAACSSDKAADDLNGGAGVFFETDSSDLTSTATATLDKQASWLNQYNRYSILIEGHADERGTREYNFALGARRAQAVRDYLASKGIASARLKTTSYGKERPVAVCDDISCWSQNRRGVTVLGGQSGN